MLLSLMSRGLCPLSLGPIVVAGLLVVTMCEASGPQTATQDEDLIRENLPVGSDRVRVIEVLGDRGSRLLGYRREGEAVYWIIGCDVSRRAIYGSTAIEFYFDEGGRLLRHELREVPAKP